MALVVHMMPEHSNGMFAECMNCSLDSKFKQRSSGHNAMTFRPLKCFNTDHKKDSKNQVLKSIPTPYLMAGQRVSLNGPKVRVNG